MRTRRNPFMGVSTGRSDGSSRPRAISLSVGQVARLVTALAVAALAFGFDATPVAADAAQPTNYRSQVVEIDPAVPGVRFSVAGGDAFLEVSTSPGHSILVPGYFGEPYLRIDPDNRVWVNVASPAHYINRERYGDVSIPDEASAESPPSWELVNENGTYAWHDHRTHWMSEDLPPTVAGDVEVTVFPWELSIVVDGIDTAVRGELIWLPSKSPAAPILAGIIVLLPLALLGTRSLVARVVVIALGALSAGAVTWLEAIGTPVSARTLPLAMLFPVGAAAGLVALVAMRNRRPDVSNWAGLTAGVCLAIWGYAAVSTLWMPVLLSNLPPALERSAVGVVIWAAAAVVSVHAIRILDAARGREPAN